MFDFVTKFLPFQHRFVFLKKAICYILVFSLVLTSVTIFFNSRVESSPVGWEQVINVSRQNLQAKNINVASRGRYIAVVYEANDPRDGHGIYVSVSFQFALLYRQLILLLYFMLCKFIFLKHYK